VQTFLINVVQTDGNVSQLGEAQDVNEQALGENGASGSDEGDFGHCVKLLYCTPKTGHVFGIS